jgi:hypothetical protein
VLDHPVPVVLEPLAGTGIVAASLAGDPAHARVAWVDGETGKIIARVACPPGRPSRWRPLVATEVTLLDADGPIDRVLVARLAGEATAVAPILALEEDPPSVAADPAGLVLVRMPIGVALIAADAIGPNGEPIGRIDVAGISHLETRGAAVSGRLGMGHGMGAGIGHGHWARDLDDAAFEAGYTPRLPDWVPPGLEQGRPRIEPDLAYPAAPPAVIVAWTDPQTSRRVLVRQTPAPLASPDPGGGGARTVRIGDVEGVMRGRGFATLVWETDDRAFGVQVRGMEGGEAVALRVARAIPPA